MFLDCHHDWMMMEEEYFGSLLAALASRASLGTVGWLGFANAPLRRHLMEVFARPFGDTGSFLADPSFEAVFGWAPSSSRMRDLAGNLLMPSLVNAMDSPPPELVDEYRFAKERAPYAHQLQAWQILAQQPARSLIVTSGTGSGKTECFMVPILDRLAREQLELGGPLVGVRALFLYPLNALINSQRDRLRAWTHGFGNKIRFCLYNGLTPETLPAHASARADSEVKDRRSLRAEPPPILVTNATMLEYMLVRAQDAPILEKSSGKLEWIVLDEAHTYVGSQAAELALLIRRVVHAFAVKPENLRFVATSATMGDPDGPAGERLREFLAQVAGVDIERVHLVSGARQIPLLPSASDSWRLSVAELRAIDSGKDETPNRYRALSGHPIARKLRELFVDRKAAPVAKLSEACSMIFGPAPAHSLAQQQESLNWLDLLTSAVDTGGTPFLPLRAHVFHQTLTGLWCCADSRCPDKRGSRLDDPAWTFGKVFLEPRNHCTCGAPAFEFASCEECGAAYLLSEERKGAVVQALSESAVDEFELEIDDDSETLDTDDDRPVESGHAILITNRKLPHAGEMHINRQTQQIVDASDPDAIALIVCEDGGDGLGCPACGATPARTAHIFRKARIGAPFLLGGLLPTLLEYAPDGARPADQPYRGRRLLTFSDSRQGTARLAAKLQQDAERTKARGLIYHHVLKAMTEAVAPELAEIQNLIGQYENILANPGIPEGARAPIVQMLNDARMRLEDATQPAPMSFQQLQAAIAQEGQEFRWILQTYKGYSREVFGGHEGASNLAGMLLVRELGRRPKRQNNLETMGMIAVRYPRLDQLNAAPVDWTSRGFTLPEWKDFLKVAVDHFVRGGGSLDIPDLWRNWIGIRFPRNWIVPPNQDEAARGQRRWPSARRSRDRSALVRLLAHLLKVDVDTDPGQDAVDSLLITAWEQVRTMLSLTASGYILRLQDLAFSPVAHAWVCPVTRRFLDTTVRGVTPYLPRIMREEIAVCERREIPVYDVPFGGETDGGLRIRRARDWLAQQEPLTKLREDGLWANVNDRVIESAPYFAAAEHSAQQASELLDKYEKRFKEGSINLLSCSTTMEMGIDIGGVQLVAMNNVPPHPANYLQRAGRAGRRRETRSTAVTLCKSNPHDQNVFLNTRWAFDAKLPPPVVSLNSAVIVQRHVNAMILARFLADLLQTNPQDMTRLNCGWFFDDREDAPSKRFIRWCEAYLPTAQEQVDGGLRRLVRHTLFEGQETERLVRQAGVEMEVAFDEWQAEWQALIEQEFGLGPGAAIDPAARAIGFQKKRLAEEYLLRELATQGFLPGYGFPTSIASFDNTTVSAARRLPPPDEPAKRGRDDNRFQKRDLASRDLVAALREYAPGAELVMDGLVYRSAGITLNWHVPADQEGARETQAIKFAWRCRSCGASGTTMSLKLASTCDACGAGVEAKDIQQFLEPAGFSVDFYEEPHNDVTRQQFVPVERPWISARGDWSPMPNPALGRFRVTTDGRVYHHSAGLHGKGYALCLSCGRAEPMLADGNPPRPLAPGSEHKKLRSRAADRVCGGSTNRYQIKTGIALGHQVRTDVLEIQLRDLNGQWVSHRGIALTIAVALRDALAGLLGVQTGELGCDVQETRAADNQRCQSVFIFDRYAAGYASSAERLINDMFREAAKRLDCPKACDSSCPHCILDFDQRFEAGVLDRFAALAVISTEWLGMLKIPESLRYFGDSSRVEISGMVAAVLRESSHPDAVRTRLFAGGAADSSDLAASSLRLIAYRLAALSRPIEIVIENSLFERLSEANRFALSSLADHPWISIGLATALPRATGASVLAEVSHGLSGVAWASADSESIVPNEGWGASRSPLVTGTLASRTGTVSKKLESAEIRPQVFLAGDREIVLHHQVDGPLQGFGTRLWQIISDEHHETLQQVQNSSADVVAITYSDRYLFTPLSIALLVDLVSRLKAIVGQARWDDPELTITTTAVRSGGESRVFNRVFADWPDLSVRNAVARGAFEYLGIRTTVLVPNKFSVQHGRVLEVRFSDGKTLSVRLDQGVSYWRVPVLSGARQPPVGFDFTKSAKDQIRDVVEMRVAVEGGALPTELFVKLR
jgi:DEAD/DEAH box helicase domain-containing protein